MRMMKFMTRPNLRSVILTTRKEKNSKLDRKGLGNKRDLRIDALTISHWMKLRQASLLKNSQFRESVVDLQARKILKCKNLRAKVR